MSVLTKLWWGRYSLPRTFWLFYVLGFPITWLFAAAIYVPFFFLHVRTLGFIAAFLCFFFYFVVSSIGVWRSANAYPFTGAARFWAVAAKGVVVVVVVRVLWSWANGGALNIMAHMTGGIDVGISP
jgi:hypothetical protein